jgi:peptidoglycan/LPS O-acetylase OafA/YrhL
MTAGPAPGRVTHGGADYRPDIDGLRAVAVITVIGYHAGVPGFHGGFIGVDVFFVISGFLISSIIFRQLDQGRFSLAHFYERRVRRIAPALGFLLAACTAAALVLFLPNDLWRFCKSLVATLLFASNIYFWRSSGYFDTAAATKPLLHTWSLAIEEQFYLVFPLAALLVARYLPRRRLAVFLACLGLSLAACIIITPRSRESGFYLPVTRAWELLVGIVLACRPLPVRSPALRAAGSALGLAAIIAAAVVYTPATSFPGVAALLPTLGAALVIGLHTEGDPVTAPLLSAPPAVLTGRMSYSLYLWHWPVLVFFRQLAAREPGPGELSLLLAGIVAVSAFSWRFVEEPCRRPARMGFRRLAAGAVAAGIVLLLAGIAGWRTRGFAFLQPAGVNAFLAGARDVNPDRHRCFDRGVLLMDRRAPCRLGPDGKTRPAFLAWGDSHANAVMPVLGALASERGISGLFTGASGCAPLVGVRRADRHDDCARLADSAVAMVARLRIRDVLLAAYWSVYTEGWETRPAPPEPLLRNPAGDDATPPREVMAAAIERTVDALQGAGARVWILEQVPSQPREPPTWLATIVKQGGDAAAAGRPLAEHRRRQAPVAGILRAVGGTRAVHLLDPATILCTGTLCPAAGGGRSLYADDNHLSTWGAMRLRPLFAPLFDSMAAGVTVE